MSVYIPHRKDGTAKSQFYQFDFQLKPAGKPKSERFFGSTGQRTKTAADRIETKLRELAASGKLGELLNLGDACERYMEEVGRHAPTEHAVKQNELCMRELITYYGEDAPLVSISPDSVARAASERSRVPCTRWKNVDGKLREVATKMPSPATVNRQVIEPMRRLLRRAQKHWKMPIDLDQFTWGGKEGIKRAEPEGIVREITRGEELSLWPVLDPDYHDIVEMYIITGKRRSNWLMVPKFKIDLAEAKVKMRKLKKREGWTEYDFQLNERELEIATKAYHEAPNCEYLFTARCKREPDRKKYGERRPISVEMLKKAVKGAFARAGIKDARIHDFRHTFGSRAAATTANLKELQEAMDHSVLDSTMRYVNVRQERVKQLRSNVRVCKDIPANVKRLKSKD